MQPHVTRRNFLASTTTVGSTAALGATTMLSASTAAESRSKNFPRWRYCLNSGTISGHKLTIEEQVQLAATAGYDGIEPWVRDIETFVEQGGKLSDLKKQIADAGLRVEGAIGFAHWIVNDPHQRQSGLEQARQDMDLIREIGGMRIAAPPAGATGDEPLDLLEAAQRYRKLLEIGANIGVVPQLEIWGFSTHLSQLGEVSQVAIDAGHPDACLLLDIYHLYKGGSSFASLHLLAGQAMHCFHVNDYPADPPREIIGDKDRIYPGDGIAPLDEIFQTLATGGFTGALSLELFNRQYWQQPAESVARKGLQKMKSAVAHALE
ncbi:MAG: sugar phosphate isomerase/epimerase family protein [Pirellulales bacterium]